MDLGLKGRVALVTGATRGIGRATAISLAQEGADVIACARDAEKLVALKEEIEKRFGVHVYLCMCDATKEDEVKTALLGVLRSIDKLDILVNNIGGVGPQEHAKFHELNNDDWRRMYEFNTMTAVTFIRETLQLLKKSNQARIINISSIAGRQPGGFNPHYGSAKAGMFNLTKHLANDFAKYGILVNVICPSTISDGIWTSHVQNKADNEGLTFAEAEKKMREEVSMKAPLGVGTAEDVAWMATFLASDKARFITGACFDVDGGTVKSIL